MPDTSQTRRRFLSASAASAAGGLILPGAFVSTAMGYQKPESSGERPGIGVVGLRYQGSVIAEKAKLYGDIAAVCDIDFHVRKQAKAAFGSRPADYEDYRDLLRNKNVDIVLIGTPDHWHSKILIDAVRAGKDVYCEKPLTLTIDEGKAIRDAVAETGRVVQVGSWQRSDSRFRLAVEMVRSGRIGRLQKVEVVLGKNGVGGPFEVTKPPQNINWNLWQGQTPDVPYIQERCHYTFRWWYEYSGGQMTDWGAHHLDIAQWAINSLPVEISGTASYPAVDNGYNVAVDFHAQYLYANGVEMTVSDTGRNGILFTGTQGRMFVNRGTISGSPVERLQQDPLPRDRFSVYGSDNLKRPERAGKLDAIINHMGNFFDCIESRNRPVSDVESQHRSVSTCHLGNIAMKLGRTVKWNPETEEFPGDAAANALRSRQQRTGYEIG